MNIKTFSRLLLIMVVILQVGVLAFTIHHWNLYGAKGAGTGLAIGFVLYLALFLGFRKIKIEGSDKDANDLSDFFAMIPWILVAIVVVTLVGAGIGIYLDSQQNVMAPVGISCLNTALLISALAISAKVVKN